MADAEVVGVEKTEGGGRVRWVLQLFSWKRVAPETASSNIPGKVVPSSGAPDGAFIPQLIWTGIPANVMVIPTTAEVTVMLAFTISNPP
jgi:hypothetical protein